MSETTIPYVSQEFFEEQTEKFNKEFNQTLTLFQLYSVIFGNSRIHYYINNTIPQMNSFINSIKKLVAKEHLLPKIYIKKGNHSIESLIQQFIYVQNTTYFDPEFKCEQCDHGRMRSFDDLWAICNTYFPDITAKEVFQELLNYGFNKPALLCFSNCSTIRKIRITADTSKNKQFVTSVLNIKYNSIYNWEELFQMIGLETRTAIIEYLNNNEKLKSSNRIYYAV